MTRDEILAALTERDTIALTLHHEARRTTAGRVSVGLVIAARVRDGRYGTGFKAVCLRQSQFSCWWPFGGLANHHRIMAAAERIVSGDKTVWSQDEGLRECAQIADALVIAGLATHYLTTALYATHPPAWAKGKPIAGEVGGHLFFNNVD